jgi:hypothetical protein
MAATILAGLATLATSQAFAGDRLIVHLDRPFEVAGETFQSGEISVRRVHTYSPVSTLEEVCVDRHCVGLLVSRQLGTYRATRDALIFTRAEGGLLVLRGITRTGEAERDLADPSVATLARNAASSGLLAEVGATN